MVRSLRRRAERSATAPDKGSIQDPDTAPAARRAGTTPELVQYWAVTLVAAGLVGFLTGVLDDDSFERFFGPIPPLAGAAVLAVIGAVSLRVLATRGWLPTEALPLGRLYRPALVGVAFALPAVVVDSWIHFPEDMNAPWPASLVFYPAVAYVAEIVFHLAPLALVLTALRWVLDRHPADTKRAVSAALAVALVEAVFQTLDALSGSDQRLALFVAPHLAAIGFVELAILRRHGFLAMLSFRLGYYLIWHIAWGAIRLTVLF